MKLPNQAMSIMRYTSTVAISDRTSIGIRPQGGCYYQANYIGKGFYSDTKANCCALEESYMANPVGGNCENCPRPVPQNNPSARQVPEFEVGRPPGVWPPKYYGGSY
jgi:hypothetical protein